MFLETNHPMKLTIYYNTNDWRQPQRLETQKAKQPREDKLLRNLLLMA